MRHPVTGVDHCYLLVEDLDRSLEQFERLGFTVSPRGFHSAAKGTANHTIMLTADDYFELLGIVAETENNAPQREMLQRDGEGLYAVACRIDSATDAKERLDALAVSTGNVQRFERPVPLPNGGEGIAAFSTLPFSPHEVPVGIAFMCQHHTRDTVWLPELMAHPNGATALAGILAAHADPKAAAEAYSRLFGAGKTVAVAGGFGVVTGSIPVTFLTAQELASRYAGLDIGRTPRRAFAVLQIAVRDLHSAKTVLSRNSVETHATAGGFAVDPAFAGGAVIEFVAT